DQVAGLRGAARGQRAAGALRPVPDGADRAEALALLAERHAGLPRGPRGEVRAPGTDARAGGRRAVLGDPRRVVAARGLLGLADHRRAGLGQDLVLGELHRLRGHVDVADAALGADQVLLVDADVVQRVLEAVLDRAERGALGRDGVDGGVDLGDVGVAGGRE